MAAQLGEVNRKMSQMAMRRRQEVDGLLSLVEQQKEQLQVIIRR